MPDAQSEPLALIASPYEWVARSLESILTPHGYRVVRVARGGEVLRAAEEHSPDVVLLGAALPDASGYVVCRTLRSLEGLAATMPVLITAETAVTRQQRLEALRAGAWDCLGFPWDAEELLLKLETYSRARVAFTSMSEASLVDPVTGCYSAQGLVRRAREISADASRHARAMACVTIAPDASLPATPPADGTVEVGVRDLGQALERQIRESDSVGRIGASEFVVLAPDTDARGALRLAERLADAAEAMLAAHGVHPAPRVRAGCFGVGNFRDASIDPVEMMTRATLALRQSQTEPAGPRVQFFRSDA